MRPRCGFRHVGANPFGLGDGQREHRPLRRGHVARLEQAGADHGGDRRAQLAVLDLALDQRLLRAGIVELLLGLRDVFLARAGDHELHRLAGALGLRERHLPVGHCVVQVLPADTLARRRVAGRLQAGDLPGRQIGFGFGRGQVRARLRDLFRPAARFQPQQGLLLDADLRLGLRQPQARRAFIEHAEHVAGPDLVAFANAQFGNALAGVEGQRHLADIDVAVERELVWVVGRLVRLPGPDSACDQRDRHDRGGQGELLVHGRGSPVRGGVAAILAAGSAPAPAPTPGSMPLVGRAGRCEHRVHNPGEPPCPSRCSMPSP